MKSRGHGFDAAVSDKKIRIILVAHFKILVHSTLDGDVSQKRLKLTVEKEIEIIYFFSHHMTLRLL